MRTRAHSCDNNHNDDVIVALLLLLSCCMANEGKGKVQAGEVDQEPRCMVTTMTMTAMQSLCYHCCCHQVVG